MPTKTVVIVGASLAGAKAAEALRAKGFDGSVILVGEEGDRPYERPALSKEYLRGEPDAPAPFVHDEAFYAEHGIDLRTRATALDPAARTVELVATNGNDGGERVRYDKLLFCTGLRPRKLRLPGSDLEGVRYLRRLNDSRGLRQAITTARRLVVVGAGWIGSEVAASARQLGCAVTMVAPEAVPLERVLGPQVGAVYRDLHRDRGVDLRLSSGVEAVLGSGRVEAVRLSDGQQVAADVVLIGAGALPRDELARDAGLRVDDGIVVDEYLQTSAPDIYAAGDVANAWHPVLQRMIRVEHWANAKSQGPAAAGSILGEHTAYDKLPYFYSDQYDLGMEYHGFAEDWDQVVFRGDPRGREFLAFWVKEGRVVAGMNANVWDQGDGIKALVRSDGTVDPGRLADPDVALEDLA